MDGTSCNRFGVGGDLSIQVAKLDRNELKDIIKGYLNHIRDANDFLIAYKSICKSASDYNDELNLSPGFFNIALIACLNSFVLELAKLYDNRHEDEKTFFKLLGIIGGNSKLFPCSIQIEYLLDKNTIFRDEEKFDVLAEVAKAKSFIDENQSIIEYLKGRRDGCLAHNDKHYFLDTKKIMEDYPITFQEARTLLEYADKFCNRMLVALCNESVICRSENSDDLCNLLCKVQL